MHLRIISNTEAAMVVRSVGAATVARLMAIDSGTDFALALPEGALEALMFGANPGVQAERNARSRAATATSSRSAHSQTTSADQSEPDSAANAAASRAWFRAILTAQ